MYRTMKKKELNADSPSFMPSFSNNSMTTVSNSSDTTTNNNNGSGGTPKPTLSPHNAESAAPFIPKTFAPSSSNNPTNGQFKVGGPAFNPENVFSPRPLSAQSGATTGSSSTAGPGTGSIGTNSGGYMNVNSPGFIPSTGAAVDLNSPSAPSTPGIGTNNFIPPSTTTMSSNSGTVDSTTGSGAGMVAGFNSLALDHSSTAETQQPVPPPPPPPPQGPPIPFQAAGQDMMFQQPTTYPLQYHLYAPRPEINPLRLEPYQRTAEDYFISSSLREDLQRKNEVSLQKFPQMMLPEFVHVYHSLFPLDTNSEKSTRMFGHPTWVYRATSNYDGRIYCLRRVEGYRLTNERAMSVIKHWEKVQSPSVIALREAFTSRAFGDSSLIFVYDFYPMAETLYDHHFGTSAQFNHHEYNRGFLREGILWNYTTQLISALKSIHKANLAARTIDPTRVLLSGQGRIRLNCVGIFDLLNFDNNSSGYTLEDLQQQDFESLGRLLLGLASNSLNNVTQDINKGLQMVSQVYSKQFHTLLTYLLTTPIDAEREEKPEQDQERTNKSVDSIINLISDKFVDSMNGALLNNDYMEGELSKELENGRLFRLLCKFGFINERPEFDHDPSWSESGDRYLIKLFRDYVFHQVDESGKPVVDMGHVLTCLNKLDAGIDENVMLVSRDEQNCLIVSYKELKTCIQTAFRDLLK